MLKHPPAFLLDDSAIFSIANELADYVMDAKLEQDGKALEDVLAVIQNAGMEIK